jgi:hypothetical protein
MGPSAEENRYHSGSSGIMTRTDMRD